MQIVTAVGLCLGCQEPIPRRYTVGKPPRRCAKCWPKKLVLCSCDDCGRWYQARNTNSTPPESWGRDFDRCPECHAVHRKWYCKNPACGKLLVPSYIPKMTRSDRETCDAHCLSEWRYKQSPVFFKRQEIRKPGARHCRWCKADISHRRADAIHCGPACKANERHWEGRVRSDAGICVSCHEPFAGGRPVGGRSGRLHCGKEECRRKISRLKRFSMSPDDYEVVLAMQDGHCALCLREIDDDGRALGVDHDHLCPHHDASRGCPECVRGVLCNNHNLMLGYAKDDFTVFAPQVREYLTRRPLMERQLRLIS